MDLKWLEDFVSLAETRSFSRSAELRHVTQPAFSRRIQALEAWLGTELIDRSVYPTRLTDAGQVFHEQALALLSQMREARALLRSQGGAQHATLALAVPHTLSLTFFPRWLQRIEQRLAESGALSTAKLKTRMRAQNVHDALLSLVEGGCDLVMAYHHPSHPVVLDPTRYEMAVLGQEAISLFSAPAGAPVPGGGEPRFPLPTNGKRVPFLAYTLNAYLGRMAAYIMAHAPVPLGFEQVYETDMAEGLKAMALEGHGVAFLPHSAVQDECASGRLVRLDAQGAIPKPLDGALTISMEIRLYRDRLALNGNMTNRTQLEQVWAAAQAEAGISMSALPAKIF